MKLINKILFKISLILIYVKFKRKRVINNNKQKALINLSSHNPNRRLFQIIYHFYYNGYSCYVDISFFHFMKCDKYGLKSFYLEEVYPAAGNISGNNYSFIVSDHKEYFENFKDSKMSIFINFNLFVNLKNITEDDFFYPLLSHVNYLHPSFEENTVSRALTSERKIGAIFAGNADINSYNLEATKSLFGIYTRNEMFYHIINKLPGDILYIPENLESFIRDMENGILRNRIVLLNTETFSLSEDIYFNILLSCDFYIYMCGYVKPYCHNQFESMMSGCIPITQFANLFIPPFQHEVNSLLFNNLNELIDILMNISTGKYQNDICLMRKNILDYYKRYYSLQSFNYKIINLLNKRINHANYYLSMDSIKYLDENIQSY